MSGRRDTCRLVRLACLLTGPCAALQLATSSATPATSVAAAAVPVLARAQCPANTFQCPASLGTSFEDVCCQIGQTCAFDSQNSPACCPSGAVCTGTAPATPAPTIAVSYVPNQYFSFPYAATTLENGASCASAVQACRSNYDACVTGLQGNAGYAVTVNVPGGGGFTVDGGQRNLGASATLICSSLSSQACAGLEATRCVSFGQQSSASAGPPRHSFLLALVGPSVVFTVLSKVRL